MAAYLAATRADRLKTTLMQLRSSAGTRAASGTVYLTSAQAAISMIFSASTMHSS